MTNIEKGSDQHPDLKAPITDLKGVGPAVAKILAKMAIATIQDLLLHLPIRYVDRTRLTPMAQLTTGISAQIQGHVLKSQVEMGRRRSLSVMLEDDSGTTTLRFFHFNVAQKNQLSEGALVRCFGEPRLGRNGLEFYHPEYACVDATTPLEAETLTPVYGLTEGLSQARLKKIMAIALAWLKEYHFEELLPREINQRFAVQSLSDALHLIHHPPKDVPPQVLMAGQHPYQQRLAFEELLAHFLVRQETRTLHRAQKSPAISWHDGHSAALLEQLPFSPTGAQLRVLDEIRRDLHKAQPMLRMVQGDVGSGKTFVAAVLALQMAKSGYQVAIVAPTEILAEQHRMTMSRWLEPLSLKVTWLVSKLGAKARRESLTAIADGTAHIIVGTHALFQEGVQFANLGLAVIDEQHRFGVDQRLTLRKPNYQGEIPHQLIMTATPIPRTLAMTAYSELDCSIIDELPPGRTPVQTALISQSKRPQIMQRIRDACLSGKQAYWVCTLVENSETLSAANAEETFEQLQALLPGVTIGLVHGRLKPAEKEATMAAFKANGLNLLVATTVIEVGVDVPNASLMIIENPERLGLAQLHQLRGRVGRGKAASHCVLLYGEKLSRQGRERLSMMRQSNNGFEIAEKDLELRGPGELLGTRQTGDMIYRIADLQRDFALIEPVHDVGKRLLAAQPDACRKIIQRWFAQRKAYAQV